MNFIVRGIDYTDSDALNRRMAARQAHMENIEKMYADGSLLYAGAMLNEAGDMAGSTLFLEMDSKEDVEAYIQEEAYVKGKVWEYVSIEVCKIPPLFKK